MALFKILHGDSSNISLDVTPFHEGWCYVTHNGYFYIDLNIGTEDTPNNQRIKLNAKEAEALTGYNIVTILNSSDIEIPTSKAVLDALHEYVDSKTADDFGVYVHDTEPANAVAGDIWVDTANDPSYIVPTIPEITDADNGKVLMVVDGKLQLVSLNISVDANGVVSI